MSKNWVWCVALVLPAAVAAQDRMQQRYDSAYYAWDGGNYTDALVRFQRLLNVTGGERFLEPIALVTGELFRSIEVVPPNRLVIAITDARAPKWSADGRHLAFETTAGSRRTGHIYRLENGEARQVAQVDGYGIAFSNDGLRAAFLRVVEDDELRAARAQQGGGRGGRGGGGANPVTALEAAKAVVIERDLASGSETIVPTPGIGRNAVHYNTQNQLFVTGTRAASPAQVYRVTGTGEPEAVTTAAAPVSVLQPLAGGRLLVVLGNAAFGILDPSTRVLRTISGTLPSASADGQRVVYLTRADNQSAIQVIPVLQESAPVEVKRTPLPLTNPVLSPDGQRVAFQMTPRDDQELYVVDADGKNESRITRDIQHDHTPRFLSSDRLLGLIGENRHRRSFVHDLSTRERTRLFHNNQIRTVSMEYFWAVSPDGSKVFIVADRDGDTISPERGVYVLDLGTKVSKTDVLARLASMQAAETDLRERGRRMFAGIAPRVRAVLQDASVARVYGYEKALYDFDSKYITQPGNAKAIEYIASTLRSFGYEPEIQWFETAATQQRPAVRTANIIATLRGTAQPELQYVVSSHFDSVERGPGADDDTSGSAALLEAARILAGKPMPTTIRFAWFTGEEAGLLGSREFVRQAVAKGDRIIGALNNDMVGYANDHHLDNTIRYSNAGLRDLQHAAAFLFTNLVTYDSKYYQSTDAAAYFDAYGDIVGGIGSYPILSSPHYHQPHDLLSNMNHQLITEVAKTTAATLMLMASSPSRLKEVTATASGAGADVTWSPAVEKSVNAYIVRYWTRGQALPRDARVTATRATLPGLTAGDTVWVKGVNAAGMDGWDWQRTVVK